MKERLIYILGMVKIYSIYYGKVFKIYTTKHIHKLKNIKNRV